MQGVNGIAVAQAFGDTVVACSDVRLLHDGDHASPSGGARPRPQGLIEFALPATPLDVFEAVHQVERVQQCRGYWHGSIHAWAAF
jgi:hypothetical protein